MGDRRGRFLGIVPETRRPEAVQAFLDPLRVIPGIGPKTEAFLHEKSITTVAELRHVELAQLTGWFGKWGGPVSKGPRCLR
jgi:predicted flap endonuclease-1-like 5' DNA nuclease